MYLTKTPRFIQSLFPQYLWRMGNVSKSVYLTFDDGPVPEVTPWVVETLDAYNAKGTFFCVGDNVRKYPAIFDQVKASGHSIGNHTFNHLNGWTTDNIPYFHNIRKCARLVNSNLFRPPYGRVTPKQMQFLSRHYKIVMWDVLSGDFDASISEEQCYQNVIRNTFPGSIIVFHDSIKSQVKLRTVLPRVLETLTKKGYTFEAIKAEKQIISSPKAFAERI